jgi:rhomboid-related protein 1/2/3
MKTGVHFQRLGADGKLEDTNIKMANNNQSIVYAVSGGGLVTLNFDHLVGVTDLGHASHSTPQQLTVERLMPDPSTQSAKALMLIFQDPSAPALSPDDIAALGPRFGPAKAILAYAVTQVPASAHLAQGAKAGSSADNAAKLSGLGVVSGNGMDVLILVSDSVEAKKQALEGFGCAADFAHAHADTHGDLDDEPGTDGKGHFMAMHPHSVVSRWLGHLHHLYRPHHNHNHPPSRFHNGIVAEVQYDPSYAMELEMPGNGQAGQASTFKSMKTPNPAFGPGMYFRAVITHYDVDHETYDLTYQDGPYIGDETPDGHKALAIKKAPNALFHAKGVKGAFISVDMSDNYSSHFPLCLLALSGVQCFCFFYYVYAVLNNATLEETGPVGGPAVWWMRVIETFPDCSDLRPQGWRLWSYQLVHAGAGHIGSNMVMQNLFGLPINMVHGNLRFFIIYQVGVLAGAMTFVLIGGGQNALVGCSGGVYTILGVHFAELLMNWGSENKGLLNHWTRLLIMCSIIGLDFYLYSADPSQSTSYTAHVGGFSAGAVFGVLLLDNLEVTWLERMVIIPFTVVFAAAMVTWAIYNYTAYFPPQNFFYEIPKDSCCVQMLDCDGLKEESFDQFRCSNLVDLTRANGLTVLETCNEMLKYIETKAE